MSDLFRFEVFEAQSHKGYGETIRIRPIKFSVYLWILLILLVLCLYFLSTIKITQKETIHGQVIENREGRWHAIAMIPPHLIQNFQVEQNINLFFDAFSETTTTHSQALVKHINYTIITPETDYFHPSQNMTHPHHNLPAYFLIDLLLVESSISVGELDIPLQKGLSFSGVLNFKERSLLSLFNIN